MFAILHFILLFVDHLFVSNERDSPKRNIAISLYLSYTCDRFECVLNVLCVEDRLLQFLFLTFSVWNLIFILLVAFVRETRTFESQENIFLLFVNIIIHISNQ